MSLLTTNNVKQLSDYQKPSFSIENTQLTVNILETETLVTAVLTIKRVISNSEPLILDGDKLELIDLQLDGAQLSEKNYQIKWTSKEASQLVIYAPPNEFVLTLHTRIYPIKNTSLQGLYCSNKVYCTQCEAEGFRSITYYLDRPDILAKFTTKIIADKNQYPVLLSNGNLVDEGLEGEDRHYKTYEDPHPKPSYLFALVAGNLTLTQDQFITLYKKQVTLSFYTEPGDENKTLFAIKALKKAMKSVTEAMDKFNKN